MVESQATHLKSVSIGQVIAAHLWPGLTILALFCALAPVFIAFDVPSFAAILLIEVAFLAPFVAYKLRGVSLRATGNASLRGAIPFFERSGALRYVWAVPLGLAVAIGAFEVLGPVDDALRHAAFGWLPSWHYSVDLAQRDPVSLRWYFVAAIFIDGLIGPTAEELYFRGYLLPRMAHLGPIAPLLNAFLFAIYHFWQPMNYPSLIAASLVFAYSAWWSRDVRLPWAMHCAMNVLGHTLGVLSTFP